MREFRESMQCGCSQRTRFSSVLSAARRIEWGCAENALAAEIRW
jgi:hypothetical protein